MINTEIMNVQEDTFAKMAMPQYAQLVITVIKKLLISLFHVLMGNIIGKLGKLSVISVQ